MTKEELLRAWWPWIALALGIVVIAVGGMLFSATAIS